MVSVSLSGLDKAFDNIDILKALPKTRETKMVLHNAGLAVRKWARFYAPYDKNRRKGTHLRDAILVSDGPLAFTDVLVVVRYKRPGAPHAHLLEFGTVKMAARPFMRPAAATAKPEVEQILHKELLSLIVNTPKS